MAREYSERGAVVLAINYRDSAETIAKYFKEQGFSIRPLRQKRAEVNRAFGVSAYPTNVVIDREGKVAGRWVGFDEDAIRQALDKVVAR
ncbi:MAG: TlpA family protein disulfide reductase [Planctomycetes bacterium]|nr:TlpA family protein disulfide reductase [Planctomycetota bacterium]